MAEYKLNVNGAVRTIQAEPDMPLLWALRDLLGLTATKYGCGAGVCGSCCVLIDGRSEQSCMVPVADVGAKRVVTLEGLSARGLSAVQKAWIDHDVPQCGYCQAGMIISATALLKANPRPTRAQIDDAMNGNLCRCGTYPRVRKAIEAVAKGEIK